jgi:hypothetical protein
MKHILAPIALLCLASCSTPEQNAKLADISNIALTYAETKGAITPQDAALVREAGKVLLAPASEEPVILGERTSAK